MASRIFFVLVTVIVILQVAEATFFENPDSVNFDLIGIPVTLYCTPDGNMNTSGAAAPPLIKGANVELVCGNKEIIANVTTDNFGIGYLITNPQPLLPYMPPQNNCMLEVSTVQSSCNRTLAGVLLESALRFIGASIFGNMKIANYAPTGFKIRYPSSR